MFSAGFFFFYPGDIKERSQGVKGLQRIMSRSERKENIPVDQEEKGGRWLLAGEHKSLIH